MSGGSRRATWAALVALALTTAVPGHAADQAFDKFTTGAGGFSLDLPAGWHRVEETGPRSYRAVLSREKVEKQGDSYTYGLSVTRYRGWRDFMPALPADPGAAAEAYANQLASQFEGGQTVVIDGGYDATYGMNLRYFHVAASLGTADCLQVRLLIGIDGKQWFTALWKVPCAEFESLDKEVRHVRESLRIEEKWGSQRQ